MKSKSYNEIQIEKILKEHENGKSIPEICFEYNISRATFYNWGKRYKSEESTQRKRIEELEQENYSLKRMFAELSLNHQLLQEKINEK